MPGQSHIHLQGIIPNRSSIASPKNGPSKIIKMCKTNPICMRHSRLQHSTKNLRERIYGVPTKMRDQTQIPCKPMSIIELHNPGQSTIVILKMQISAFSYVGGTRRGRHPCYELAAGSSAVGGPIREGPCGTKGQLDGKGWGRRGRLPPTNRIYVDENIKRVSACGTQF